MVRNKTLTIAAAALTGLLAGSNARAMGATAPTSGSSITHSTAGQKAISLDGDKHACKGQNSCKGQGGCKSADNSCKGQNSCKGKGGCKTMDEGATTKPSAL